MTKKPSVVERNPNLSTKMPDRVGPRKLPKKNEEVHMPMKNLNSWSKNCIISKLSWLNPLGVIFGLKLWSNQLLVD